MKGRVEGQTITEYCTLEKMFLDTLNELAPQKTKLVRANHKPYVTKKMRKAIMLRSQLQNRYFKCGTEESHRAYRHHRNYCNRLYKKERRSFYGNIRLDCVTDNKKFWNTVGPLFGDKGGKRENIVLVEGGMLYRGILRWLRHLM